MKRKVKIVRKARTKICDPAVCDYCLYIGDGDLICEKHIAEPDKVLVVDKWIPTENYLQCQNKHRRLKLYGREEK